MATIRFNQIADARGSVNGTVYSRGIGGLYMKNRVKPTNPQSTKQVAVRARLAGLASAWRGLTDAQRNEWREIVANYPAVNRVGETYTPSGYQVYMTLNSNLQAANSATISSPLVPAAMTETTVSNAVFTLTAGVLTSGEINLTTDNSADETVIIESTSSLSAGIGSPSSALFKAIFSTATTDTNFSFIPEYQAVFGNPLVGARVFVKAFLVNRNTGQRSFIGKVSAVVTTV